MPAIHSRAQSLLAAACLSVALLAAANAAEPIQLTLPLDCELGRTCVIQNYVDRDPSAQAQDYACGTLTYNGHNGTDFRVLSSAAMRSGVNVLAAADGRVARTRDGMEDVSIRAPGAEAVADRECGNGVLIRHQNDVDTQYCHLAKGSVRVKPGDEVRAGQPLGQVGLSGRTEFPHLHLTVRHQGKVIDPFAFGAAEAACGGGTSLWKASIREALAYRERSVLNAGFAPGPITMEQIESGEAGRTLPGPESEALVAFVRAIGLKTGDMQRLTVRLPSGQVLADSQLDPLESNKAQVFLFAGKKRPVGSWPRGTYQAQYSVTRDGRIVLERSFSLTM
jgi:hypothetical protein